MTKQQKTILFWASLSLVIVLGLFLLAATQQKLETAATTNTVSFNGEGKVIATPDVAVLSLSILTEATSSKAAQDDNSKKSKALVDFLKKENVADADIKTTNYNIYPQYTYRPNAKPEISGYQVNQSLEVKVRDLDQVSVILDGAVSAGANQVSNLGFRIDDPDRLKAEARAKAIADAKQKAAGLRRQLGIDLGRIINFSESAGGNLPPQILYDTKSGLGGAEGGPSLPTGENEVIVNVIITYQIR